MTPRKQAIYRSVKWFSLTALIVSMALTSSAYAQSAGASPGGLPPEFWAGALLTVGLALITGYARGIDKRVSMIEYDNRNLQSQISGLREMLKGEYHPKAEIHDQLDELKTMMSALHRRMDYFAGGQSHRLPLEER